MSNDFKNNDDYKKIFSFHKTIADRIISRESNYLEFKESFNWNSKDRYAKTIAAFANNMGGYIVFGIKNNPRDLVGLNSSNFEEMEEEKVTSYLNSVFAPMIIFEKFVITERSKSVGILYIHQAEEKPVICLKNDGTLKEGEIYYRYGGRSEKIKFAEIKKLFDIVKAEERKGWMEHLERISKIGPMNAAVMDTIEGEITGKTGTLIIDKKLIPKLKFINQGKFQEKGKPVLKLIGDVRPVSIPVRSNKTDKMDVQITDDKKAPVYRIEEEDIRKEYPLDYYGLLDGMRERYVDFKANSFFHQGRKRIIRENKNLSRIRYLDPENIKGVQKVFYSPKIIKEFDKVYTKKKKFGIF